MTITKRKFNTLVKEVRACTICEKHLPLGPRPVFQLDPAAKILIVGQAPGTRVHETGITFNDPSGDRLREWLGVGRDEFYDPKKFAILPMGFCYPGTGKSGDLPPRPECAETWRAKLLECLPVLEFKFILGQYAIDYHLGKSKGTLTDKVKQWRDYWPEMVPAPHPSPRNNRWLKNNPWFEQELIPEVQQRVKKILGK